MGRNETDTRMASILLMIIQVVCWIGFAYDEYGVFDTAVYDMYIGVALMMLVGFGYLMTFLQSYGLGAVGFTCASSRLSPMFWSRAHRSPFPPSLTCVPHHTDATQSSSRQSRSRSISC